MKSYNCPDCMMVINPDTAYYDPCPTCTRYLCQQRTYTELADTPICGDCGNPLVKQYPPSYSSTVFKEWFCTNCGKYPMSITYMIKY